MEYNVLTFAAFEKQYKRLSKKHPSLRSEISELINSLKTNPKKGTGIGRDCFKIRLAISSKEKVNLAAHV